MTIAEACNRRFSSKYRKQFLEILQIESEQLLTVKSRVDCIAILENPIRPLVNNLLHVLNMRVENTIKLYELICRT